MLKNLNHAPSFYEINGNICCLHTHADFMQMAKAKRGEPLSEGWGVEEHLRLGKQQWRRCSKPPWSRRGLFARISAPCTRAFCSRSSALQEEDVRTELLSVYFHLSQSYHAAVFGLGGRNPSPPTGRCRCSPHL